MKRFILVSLIAAAFFILYTGPAKAQEAPPTDIVFCGELEADDCARLAASPEAMAGLTSGASANMMEVTVYPAAMPASAPISVSVGLDGVIAASPAPIDRMAVPARLTEALTLPLPIDTAQTMRISLSPILVEALAARLDVELPNTLTFQNRVVDGVAYVHMADFASVWPEAARFVEWISISPSGNSVEVMIFPAATPASVPISASIGLDGAFVAPPTTIERMAELAAMGEEAIMADPALVSEALTLPFTIDRAQTVRVSLSPSLADTFGFQMETEVPFALSFHTRFVDGIAYIRMADFAGFWPEATRFGEWIGIDVMFIVGDMLTQRVAAGQVTPSEVAEALTPPGAELPGAYIISVPPDQEEAYADFVEIIALRDTIVDGHAAAVYRIRWDLPAYLASPVVAERVYTASSGRINLAPIAPLILMLTTAVLQSVDNQVVQQVGLSEPFLYERDTVGGWSLGNLRFEVRNLSANRDLNALEAIPAPEDAFVPPLGLIWGLIQAVRQR